MEAIHDWIAPILIRALDEYLEATDSKYLHVEDDLSNLYIHCGNVEFVQLVEVLASPYLQTRYPSTNFFVRAADEVSHKYVA
jgi:hypothetical protein